MDMYTQLKTLANKAADHIIPLQRGTEWNVSTACHALIAANTGFGKSYFLNYLLIMFALKGAIIFGADPKRSDFSSLAAFMPPKRIVHETEHIMEMTEKVISLMDARYAFMETERIKRNLFQADFVDFGLPIVFFAIEEVGAFTASLTTKQRDKFDVSIKRIVLTGRQAGICYCQILQNPGVQNAPTEIRSQMGLRIFLGIGGIEYRMIFGDGFSYPKRKFVPGQGLYTLAGETIAPEFIETPRLDKTQLADCLKRALEPQFNMTLDCNSRSPPL